MVSSGLWDYDKFFFCSTYIFIVHYVINMYPFTNQEEIKLCYKIWQ